MKKPRKTIEDKINDFLNDITGPELTNFLGDVIPLLKLYNIEEDDDWLKDEVGQEDCKNVRLIRTVYLMSKIASCYAGILCNLNMKYPKLWLKMEEKAKEIGLDFNE